MAEFPATHRVGLLAALVSAVSLVVIAIEAVERLRHPGYVNSVLMIVGALIAIAVNVVIGKWLHAGAKDGINFRAAYICMSGTLGKSHRLLLKCFYERADNS